MVRSARLTRRVHDLVVVAQDLSNAPAGRLDSLCQQMLATSEESDDYLVGASCLNNDGVPLQLCLSSGSQRTTLRLIGDPGAHLVGTEARYLCAQGALDRCLEDHGAAALSGLAHSTLARLIPDTAEARRRYRQGFVWIAASPDNPGLAFYVEAAPLGQAEGWAATGEWLDEILPSSRAAGEALASLREHGVVASVGLEGTEPGNCRAKIYFRLARSMPLGQLGLDLLRSEEVARFLHLAMNERGVDLEGLVLSVGLSVESGEVVDVKVDLCGHCLTYENDRWIAVTEGLAREFGLVPPALSDALARGNCKVAFVGFGLDVARETRLNVYLQAAAPRHAPVQGEIADALTDGIRYLCALQREDGRWTDYQLPVGTCDQWITAYVGLALAQYGQRMGCPSALAAARRGAAWLCTERSYPAGWGYNATTGPDADSTAMSLGLLRELGWPIQSEDQAFLRHQWRPEGGLATYDRPDAWGCLHWDVTPWGYLGLSHEDQRALHDSFLHGLHTNRTADGMWRAYWWRNPYYSTFLTLEVLEELGLPAPSRPENPAPAGRLVVDNPFDLACLIGIKCLEAMPLGPLGPPLRALLAWQEADGRWPGHPNLRVTDPSCYAPWEEPVGSYYTDEAATITTATVARVLTRVLRTRDGVVPPGEDPPLASVRMSETSAIPQRLPDDSPTTERA